ncbi:hypothetical protein, variant [Magnaporthiopsis poae ATCC 64411]|uniref:Cellobiose dehydrogenase-like cytochrome domain-containing protein n=1 Tax=Magnaporthiopsis poae (strain ATCC 64411 / 73-15) TaxID=644358 RepID=A0A0C4DN99_MAGP6|nr:hypothetical protein, variant [Magnaporthiopsis poae ATCC 64411]
MGADKTTTGEWRADSVAGQTTTVLDRETGFTFSSYAGKYNLGTNPIQLRVAVPSDARSNEAYDAVVQIVAPREVGWVGLAWGGGMTFNPLTVAYAGGQNVMISSRWATQHAAPAMYNGASFQVFRTGTRVNGTHWQITAKCTGCTSYQARSGGGTTYVRPQAMNRLAFASARQGPSQPVSNTSAIPYHDVHQYWNHDFSAAGNPNFAALVQRNLG